MKPTTIPDKWSKRAVISDGGCWNWTGARNRDGYGSFGHDGAVRAAHRVVYEDVVGPLHSALELDHLCRNRLCCNPEHLEPVTHRENMLRGAVATKTHCKQGHPFEGANLISYQMSNGNPGRKCRECQRAAKRRWAAKNRENRRGSASA